MEMVTVLLPVIMGSLTILCPLLALEAIVPRLVIPSESCLMPAVLLSPLSKALSQWELAHGRFQAGCWQTGPLLPLLPQWFPS